jgi:hypothetical protein
MVSGAFFWSKLLRENKLFLSKKKKKNSSKPFLLISKEIASELNFAFPIRAVTCYWTECTWREVLRWTVHTEGPSLTMLWLTMFQLLQWCESKTFSRNCTSEFWNLLCSWPSGIQNSTVLWRWTAEADSSTWAPHATTGTTNHCLQWCHVAKPWGLQIRCFEPWNCQVLMAPAFSAPLNTKRVCVCVCVCVKVEVDNMNTVAGEKGRAASGGLCFLGFGWQRQEANASTWSQAAVPRD